MQMSWNGRSRHTDLKTTINHKSFVKTEPLILSQWCLIELQANKEHIVRLTRIAVIALLGIVLVSTIACSSSSTPSLTPTPTSTPIPAPTPTLTPIPTLAKGFEIYTDDTNGFSISIPESWDIYSSETEGWVVFRHNSVCGGDFPAGVVSTYSTTYTSVQAFYSEDIKSYIESSDNYDFVSEENLTIDGIPAIKIIFRDVWWEDIAGVGATDVKVIECYLIKQQTVFGITLKCDPSCWDIYESTFNTMLTSFHVLD
jgi:hypothetical protein